MREWLIKYEDSCEHTTIYECGLKKASDVWERFRREPWHDDKFIILKDIRIIQEL